jgi:uncharacterized membrane protein
MAMWGWNTLPDKLPVHWNLAGQVDRYGGKFEGVLLIPLIALGLHLLFLVLPRLDPGRANYTQFAGVYNVIRFSTLAMLATIYGTMLLAGGGYNVEVSTVISLATGILFIVLGGSMGKIRPNWFVGIRTPWTLSSKASWIQTHRAGGWLFVIIGSVQILGSFFLPPAATIGLMLCLVLGGSLGLYIYSYYAWRDDSNKTPPAGTSPS